MKEKRSFDSNSDAVFIGWQKTHTGSSFALYNVTASGNPYHGSTVSEKTIKKLNLKLPKTQYPKRMGKNFEITRQETKTN